MPGIDLPHFSAALNRLADQATYLYSDTARYWYDTQASVTRIAKDQADRLRAALTNFDAEIVRRLRVFERRSTGDFSAIRPVAPGKR
ncbi:hypothetical protein HBB16_17535 [Pseudonocardia sp. MCCB 268]|nr:hypothetical protein [Pseudonocardia cytotoxica]